MTGDMTEAEAVRRAFADDPAVTLQCVDCSWSVTQPTLIRARDFADAHAARHAHATEECSRRREWR